MRKFDNYAVLTIALWVLGTMGAAISDELVGSWYFFENSHSASSLSKDEYSYFEFVCDPTTESCVSFLYLQIQCVDNDSTLAVEAYIEEFTSTAKATCFSDAIDSTTNKGKSLESIKFYRYSLEFDYHLSQLVDTMIAGEEMKACVWTGTTEAYCSTYDLNGFKEIFRLAQEPISISSKKKEEKVALTLARNAWLGMFAFALLVSAPICWLFVRYLSRANPMASIFAYANHWATWTLFVVFIVKVPIALYQKSGEAIGSALLLLFVFPALSWLLGVLWAITVHRKEFADDEPLGNDDESKECNQVHEQDNPDIKIVSQLRNIGTRMSKGEINEVQARAELDPILRELWGQGR